MTPRKTARAPVPVTLPSTPRPRSWIMLEAVAVLAVFALACTLIFDGLGESSFHDGDEALYATVAREMTEGDRSFLTPTYWGTPFLHKPPLPYWLMAIFGAVIPGSREFGARFPSALSAVLLLALVYASTRRLAGAPAALFATALLVLNHQFLFEHAARSASFDALLSLFMFGAVVAGVKAAEGRAWWVSASVLLGLVALVKAPMVIFPAIAVLAYHWTRERRFPRTLVLRGLAVAAVVALPWHLYQLIVHGSAFWNTYVLYEIVGRVGETARDERSTPQIHLVATWWSFLPWSPLIAIALLTGIAARWRAGDARDRVVRALGIYAASILLVFCFIRSTWPWYSIPAYPALSVVTAVFLRRWYDSPARRALPLVLAALACVCVVARNQRRVRPYRTRVPPLARARAVLRLGRRQSRYLRDGRGIGDARAGGGRIATVERKGGEPGRRRDRDRAGAGLRFPVALAARGAANARQRRQSTGRRDGKGRRRAGVRAWIRPPRALRGSTGAAIIVLPARSR